MIYFQMCHVLFTSYMFTKSYMLILFSLRYRERTLLKGNLNENKFYLSSKINNQKQIIISYKLDFIVPCYLAISEEKNYLYTYDLKLILYQTKYLFSQFNSKWTILFVNVRLCDFGITKISSYQKLNQRKTKNKLNY